MSAIDKTTKQCVLICMNNEYMYGGKIYTKQEFGSQMYHKCTAFC